MHWLRFLRLDLLSLLICLILEIIKVGRFWGFHTRVKRNCFLYGHMNEVKRILTPGPSLVCESHIFSTVAVCFVLLWLIKRAFNLRESILNSTLHRILAFLTSIWFLIDVIILWQGRHRLCQSIISSSECSSELFHNMDFRAFKPRYMVAWDVYDVLRLSLICQTCALILWISFIASQVWRLKSAEKGSNSYFDETAYNNNMYRDLVELNAPDETQNAIY